MRTIDAAIFCMLTDTNGTLLVYFKSFGTQWCSMDLLKKKHIMQCVTQTETWTGRLACQRPACGASVSSSRVVFLSVHTVEKMTVKTSETRHPENTQ